MKCQQFQSTLSYDSTSAIEIIPMSIGKWITGIHEEQIKKMEQNKAQQTKSKFYGTYPIVYRV